MKANQKGIAHLAILLIIVVVAAVAGGGYWVWHNHNKKQTSSNSSTSTTSTNTATSTSPSTTTPQSSGSYMHITQWGVKVPVDSKTLGLSYTIGTSGHTASFMDTALAAISTKNCYNIVVARGLANENYSTDTGAQITYKAMYTSVAQDASTVGLVAAHVGDYYYFSVQPVATCASEANQTQESTLRQEIITNLNKMATE